jgi:hypothetical protein
LNEARATIFAELRRRGEFPLITQERAEQAGIPELERNAIKARVIRNGLEQAFGDWKFRAYCDGKLKGLDGTL